MIFQIASRGSQRRVLESCYGFKIYGMGMPVFPEFLLKVIYFFLHSTSQLDETL